MHDNFDEKIAVVELTNNKLTMRAVHAPRESLRMYLKKHIPKPIPSGDKNILNKKYINLTLLHESVIFLKHDITDLLLKHGANVNTVPTQSLETQRVFFPVLTRRLNGPTCLQFFHDNSC